MPKACENVCCHTYAKVMRMMKYTIEEDQRNNLTALKEPISCICDHPGFNGISLDPWALELEARDYVHEEGLVGDEVPINK